LKIKAENIKKKFGNKVALNGISLETEPGKLLSIIGPNGAGKSTIIKILSGQMKPDEGEVVIDDIPYSLVPKKLRGKIGVMPQEVILWDHLNLYENLIFTAKLQGIKGIQARDNAESIIAGFNLQKEKKTLVKNLSGGYKRRLNLAISIIHKPSLIFLDEPTPGVDAQSRAFLVDFIKNLKKDSTVVLTDHYLEETEKLSDYIVIIDNGEIVGEGTVKSLQDKYGQGNVITINFDIDKLTTSQIEKLQTELKDNNLLNIHFIENDLIFSNKETIEGLNVAISAAEKSGIKIKNISIKQASLEDIFLLITGKEIRD
jgi:ABC-2 type transport system ATP-binding protein